MTDAFDIYRLARERGGRVYDGGRRWTGPGPGHSRHDASLSVRIADHDRVLVHSFADDSFADCAAYLGLEARDPHWRDRASHTRVRTCRQAEAARQVNAALAFCERIWADGLPVEGDSVPERYLEARGIDWIPADLRFHPNTPRGYQTKLGGPAMLALARSVAGAPRALHAIFLTPDGRARTKRVTFGVLLGAAVRLSPVDDCLAVAEGVETAASFGKLNGFSCWASLGTENLKAFRPPALVRHLVIAADGDPPGLAAARALAERMQVRCEVTILAAPAGSDWNDVARGRVHV